MTCGCGAEDVKPGFTRCPECSRAYMRNYRATTRTIAERLALKEGQEAMRKAILEVFQNVGDRHFNGWTAQAIVRELTIG